MKKLLVLAMMATLLMAGSAFAVNRTHPVANATFSFGAPGVASGPTTTNNDDSCDIGVAPAATLLLPYFEVDVANRTQDTLFTITNVSRFPQIAHVTVWTDWSFPVLDFNIYLTGYDVQGISMNSVLNGTIGASTGTGPTQAVSPLGALSSGFTNNPNFAANIGCATQPGPLGAATVAALRTALTTGTTAGTYCGGSSAPIGGSHANAIGYITIDVNAACNQFLPTDPLYYQTQMLFDNVLIGDYQQLGPAPQGTTASSFDAGGNAMVHIRAIPEGGPANTPLAGAQTNLPFTFYDRYTPSTNRTIDRRQPLPALWAARFIQGGTGAFATNYKIWREGFGAGACGATLAANGALPVADVVRFDEHENPNTTTPCLVSPCPTTSNPLMPETSIQNTSSSNFPTIGASGDVGGWMYLNLNNLGSTGYSVTRNVGGVPTIITGAGSTSNLVTGSGTVGPRPSQNWVIVEMFGNAAGGNRLTVDFDAAWLGNGCSAAVGVTGLPPGAPAIGPAGGVPVCPGGDPACTPGAGAYTGTNTTPTP
ncbi:MAG TPA: hypothetical protein VGQ65_11345 [Thermoanaerobaculia bacterium]|jgi:hypothetical protein|nr:hypothetical protein [Thermoanaerobaculia bacterium]